MPTAVPEKASSGPPNGFGTAKRSAAILSVSAAAVVTALKLATGILTGSLGMLSESAHSGIDLIASAITLFSVQLADRPADAEHTYGHGKIESLSAFVETVIMVASCLWIVSEAAHRMIDRHLELRPSVWPFAVLAISIAVDFTRSRALARAAREHRSEALNADSVHFATDMWGSLAVMAGLATNFAGTHYGIPWLEYADPVAALVVAGVILRVSWALARQTVDSLMDATPTLDLATGRPQSADELRAALQQDLAAIPGVISVDRLRTRRSGSNYFADVTLGMPRNLTFQRSEQITMAATTVVQRHLPGADVVVHTVPTASIAESVHDRIRAVAARHGLSIHDVTVQQVDGSLHVEQHLEVDETMPLREAHELVTGLEEEMRHEVPEIGSILTHIESEPATIEQTAWLAADADLEARLRHTASRFPEVLDIHDVLVTRHRRRASDAGSEHLQVSCHCTLPDELPMARVHDVITALEGAFKLEAPEVDRLLIHPEPATDNRR
ncbi:MAG TPA: cation diffusion facilitator family transporter [Acidobacteriaceae bacterium]|nr:cation diffusion facilitator family transporter [Acidobacteriaceae bacterium]